jgi:hypothetical protein
LADGAIARPESTMFLSVEDAGTPVVQLQFTRD